MILWELGQNNVRFELLASRPFIWYMVSQNLEKNGDDHCSPPSSWGRRCFPPLGTVPPPCCYSTRAWLVQCFVGTVHALVMVKSCVRYHCALHFFFHFYDYRPKRRRFGATSLRIWLMTIPFSFIFIIFMIFQFLFHFLHATSKNHKK